MNNTPQHHMCVVSNKILIQFSILVTQWKFKTKFKKKIQNMNCIKDEKKLDFISSVQFSVLPYWTGWGDSLQASTNRTCVHTETNGKQ